MPGLCGNFLARKILGQNGWIPYTANPYPAISFPPIKVPFVQLVQATLEVPPDLITALEKPKKPNLCRKKYKKTAPPFKQKNKEIGPHTGARSAASRGLSAPRPRGTRGRGAGPRGAGRCRLGFAAWRRPRRSPPGPGPRCRGPGSAHAPCLGRWRCLVFLFFVFKHVCVCAGVCVCAFLCALLFLLFVVVAFCCFVLCCLIFMFILGGGGSMEQWEAPTF